MCWNLFLFLTLLLLIKAFDEPFTNTTNMYSILNSQNQEPINFIAIFLLSSLRLATELGEEYHEVHGGANFFARARAIQRTWANTVKHFYLVVGNGIEERRILSNPIYCQNLTVHYQERTKHIKYLYEEIYRCNGIRVLYIPYCDSSGWGPNGPCCRCEGAMNYYLNMATTTPDYPSWFLFSDDDYFTRLHKLHGILDQVDPNHPYAITHVPGRVSAGPNKMVVRMTGYAWVPFYDKDCTVPCTHRTNWLGYAIFSIGAIRVMDYENRRRGLIQTCKLWDVTHDVGLGIYVWEHSIPSLPICCGTQHPHDNNLAGGVFFHAVGKEKNGKGQIWSHDYLVHRVWEIGATKRNETYPNVTAYIEYEYNEGVKAFLPPFPNGGFENSLFYRKIQFSEIMAKQIPEIQLKNLSLNLPIRRTSYGKGACDIEMKFHLKWRSKLSDKYPLVEIDQSRKDTKEGDFAQVGGIIHEPKMCAEYLEAIMNEPVHLTDLNLPPIDDLER